MMSSPLYIGTPRGNLLRNKPILRVFYQMIYLSYYCVAVYAIIPTFGNAQRPERSLLPQWLLRLYNTLSRHKT